jgi:hypothetical protein
VTRSGAFGESKVRKDLQCGSKEFQAASGLYPHNLGVKGIKPQQRPTEIR